MKTRLKNYFLSGLIFVIPVSVTVWITVFIINRIGSFWEKIFINIPILGDFPLIIISTVGIIISLIIIVIIGFIGSSIVGRILLSLPDKILRNTPVIKNIYHATKELSDTLFLNKTSFKKVVFVEFFNDDIYTLAFITNEDKWRINNQKAYSVFVPTSPNPTSGYFIIIPESKIRNTDISVEEGLKLVVSGGMVFRHKGEFNINEYKKDN